VLSWAGAGTLLHSVKAHRSQISAVALMLTSGEGGGGADGDKVLVASGGYDEKVRRACMRPG
jgi:hypothetical protein